MATPARLWRRRIVCVPLPPRHLDARPNVARRHRTADRRMKIVPASKRQCDGRIGRQHTRTRQASVGRAPPSPRYAAAGAWPGTAAGRSSGRIRPRADRSTDGNARPRTWRRPGGDPVRPDAGPLPAPGPRAGKARRMPHTSPQRIPVNAAGSTSSDASCGSRPRSAFPSRPAAGCGTRELAAHTVGPSSPPHWRTCVCQWWASSPACSAVAAQLARSLRLSAVGVSAGAV
jgi:hypothetical protein